MDVDSQPWTSRARSAICTLRRLSAHSRAIRATDGQDHSLSPSTLRTDVRTRKQARGILAQRAAASTLHRRGNSGKGTSIRRSAGDWRWGSSTAGVLVWAARPPGSYPGGPRGDRAAGTHPSKDSVPQWWGDVKPRLPPHTTSLASPTGPEGRIASQGGSRSDPDTVGDTHTKKSCRPTRILRGASEEDGKAPRRALGHTDRCFRSW